MIKINFINFENHRKHSVDFSLIEIITTKFEFSIFAFHKSSMRTFVELFHFAKQEDE